MRGRSARTHDSRRMRAGIGTKRVSGGTCVAMQPRARAECVRNELGAGLERAQRDDDLGDRGADAGPRAEQRCDVDRDGRTRRRGHRRLLPHIGRYAVPSEAGRVADDPGRELGEVSAHDDESHDEVARRLSRRAALQLGAGASAAAVAAPYVAQLSRAAPAARRSRRRASTVRARSELACTADRDAGEVGRERGLCARRA